MACTVAGSPVATATKDIFKEHKDLRRSQSAKDLSKQARMQRSYSDNHLYHSINAIRAESSQPKLKNSHSVGIFPFHMSSSIIPNSFKSLLLDPETSKDLSLVDKAMNIVASSDGIDEEETEVKRANWVERLLEIRSHWKNRQPKGNTDADTVCNGHEENVYCGCDGEESGGCTVAYDSGEEESHETFDRESFSKLLVQVPWSDTKQFSQLAFLCNVAYVISEIKSGDLRRYYGLHYVTSSLEKKAEAATIKAKLDQDSTSLPVVRSEATESSSEKNIESKQIHPIRSSAAYDIAASAASYIHSHAKDLLSRSTTPAKENDGENSCTIRDQPKEEDDNATRVHKSVVAAHAAGSTITAVVAAGEEEKQKAAKDLQSLHSAPCEWFVCDDTSTCTRCFVIQGSDSLASWQANLFFEPTKFEGTDVIVHRGIYEAAKGIFEQFIPDILEHLKKYGDHAKFQFTGHSLGGQKILKELGIDEDHVHCVMMHRDIVPRAFSCNYPSHVALVLKRLNGSFRTHSCLIKNKLLYSPLGRLFILQPNEKSSPPHPLLPPGNVLYALDKTQRGYSSAALRAFLNNPHPLETLSDPTAYGSDGSILRDHDSSNYLKAVNGVLRQHTKMVVRKVRKQRSMLWPLLTSPSPHLWTHERSLDSSRIARKEMMTGV